MPADLSIYDDSLWHYYHHTILKEQRNYSRMLRILEWSIFPPDPLIHSIRYLWWEKRQRKSSTITFHRT